MNGHKWIVGIGAAVVVAGVVWSGSPATGTVTTAAQEADRAEQLDDEQLEQLQQRLEEARARLNLSDDQVEQVKPILRAGFEALLEVFQEHGIDLQNRSGSPGRLGLRQLRRLRGDLDGVRERTIENLDDVLTDAQIETYKEIQEENRQAMRERLRQRR